MSGAWGRRALRLHSCFHAFLQQVEGHGAAVQDLVVEGFDVELRAELGLGFVATDQNLKRLYSS